MRETREYLRFRCSRDIRSADFKPIALTRRIVAIGLLLLMCGCSQFQVKPRVVADLAGYSEGIVFDAQGTAYVSALHRETIYVIQGSTSETWYRAIEPNGHKVLHDGSHLVAARGGIHHVDPEGSLIEVLAPQLATPNDLALDGDGGVYVTVPAESEQDREAGRSGVYYLDSSRAVHKVAEEFCYPNGVVVRPDGKTLLVNDSCNRRIYEFQIASPGVLSGRRTLAEVSDPRSVPDGMTLDQAGRLYMADYGTGVIVVFSQSGVPIREYPTGLEHPSNVAFGGDALTELYVTGSPGNEDGPGRLVVLPLGVTGRGALARPDSIRGK
jgi:gluconolactonase